MKLAILNAKQADYWDKAVREVGGNDVYFSSAYHRLCETNGEGQAYLAIGESSEGSTVVAHAFMLRPIPGDNGKRFDISTVYGYGGPLIDSRSQKKAVEVFTEQFGDYCRRNSIVAGFTRFHPILRNHEEFPSWNPDFVRRTVYMDLRTSPVWESIGSKNRNMIRKAQRSGTEVVEDNSPRAYEEFVELYYHTMDRNAAADFYYFPRSYFTALAELLADRASLFLARLEGRTIAGAIILHSGGLFHYHLAASLTEYLKLAPNNLVLYTAAETAKMTGGQYFHLGGGYRGEDSLFSFKSSFSSLTAEFFVSKTIFMDDDYRELCNEMAANSETAYFPAYRGK